jgi:hypothetical protein
LAVAANRILNRRPAAAGLGLNLNTRLAELFAFSRPIERQRLPLSAFGFLAQTLTAVAAVPPRLRTVTVNRARRPTLVTRLFGFTEMPRLAARCAGPGPGPVTNGAIPCESQMPPGP